MDLPKQHDIHPSLLMEDPGQQHDNSRERSFKVKEEKAGSDSEKIQ